MFRYASFAVSSLAVLGRSIRSRVLWSRDPGVSVSCRADPEVLSVSLLPWSIGGGVVDKMTKVSRVGRESKVKTRRRPSVSSRGDHMSTILSLARASETLTILTTVDL